MKSSYLLFLVIAMSLLNSPVFSQTKTTAETDTTLLGLPGDNLDLYAVLDLFQKSKTIEAFEKSLNEEKTGINNLDLNLDGKVDFIKVETKKNGDDFTFVLQVDVSKTEKQDVAVILVSKDKDKKVTMQIVGDKDLYGKNYIVEPKTTTPAATPNPGYTGSDPLKAPVPSSTTTVVIEQTPIVQYVYSPVYVPYVPPYYYGFYPPYFAAFTCMAVSIYRHNNYYYHGGYGYHGNTTVIHNTINYNNYNSTRNTSNTVNRNNANGNYNRNNASTRPSSGAGASTQPANRKAGGAGASTQPSNRQSGGAGVSTQPSNRQSGGAGASTQPANRKSGGAGASTRQASPSTSNRQASPPSSGNRSSSGYSGGGGSRGSGGYSGGGGSRSGGGYSSGGSRGGGGRGGGGRR